MAEQINDPDAARAEIEMTRARMSETLDEIEDALLRKRERVQERMDVMAPIRERPAPSAAIAFGAGIVLGLLTGGGDEDDHDPDHSQEMEARLRQAERRADLWEHRAKRLRRMARAQERELERERRHSELRFARRRAEPVLEQEPERGAMLGRVRDGVAERVSGLIGDLFGGR